jgi:hypothetical protein
MAFNVAKDYKAFLCHRLATATSRFPLPIRWHQLNTVVAMALVEPARILWVTILLSLIANGSQAKIMLSNCKC